MGSHANAINVPTHQCVGITSLLATDEGCSGGLVHVRTLINALEGLTGVHLYN